MERRDETNADIAVKHIELPAHVSGGVVIRLFRRITEHQFHRLGQIVIRNELRAGAFADFDSITNVIAVAVRKQNRIDPFQGGEFVFAILENRIGQPRVDQEHIARGRD